MLTVKTYLAPSRIHGIGLFAAEKIPAQTTVWKYNRYIDRIISTTKFREISTGIDPQALTHLLNATYKREGRYFYLTDNARFINHSEENCNISFVNDYQEIADREIQVHEEILENYLVSYDHDDFFFQELINPDPFLYFSNLDHKIHVNA